MNQDNNGLWKLWTIKSNKRDFKPYSSHAKDYKLWVPRVKEMDVLPWKQIIFLKRVYYGLMTCKGWNSTPSFLLSNITQGLLSSGDLLHDANEKISFYEVAKKNRILWRCEACGSMGALHSTYVHRDPETNCVEYNSLELALKDPRSAVLKHIRSQKHIDNRNEYIITTEKKLLELFRNSNRNKLVNIILNELKLLKC